MPSDRTRGNRHRLKQRKLPLDTRRQVSAGIELISFIVHSSSQGTLFWICAENSVDNLEMFSLLLNSVDTEPELFCSLHHPTSKQTRSAQVVGWEDSRDI